MGARYIPKYLKHITYIPDEDTNSHQFQLGDNVFNVVMISNIPQASMSKNCIINAEIVMNSSYAISTASRLGYRTTTSSVGSVSPNSSGQNWSYANGILEISSNYFFIAGYQYDLFYQSN
jgi:hypothetical protein